MMIVPFTIPEIISLIYHDQEKENKDLTAEL